MQKLLISLMAPLLITGCSIFGVYKIDIPQGVPLTKAQAEQVKVGMNYQQVHFLLGSPTITDPLNPMRWDYAYDFRQGTNARKAKIASAHGQYLKIHFDSQGIVSKIEGLETLPESQPGLPASKEAILTAPPL